MSYPEVSNYHEGFLNKLTGSELGGLIDGGNGDPQILERYIKAKARQYEGSDNEKVKREYDRLISIANDRSLWPAFCIEEMETRLRVANNFEMRGNNSIADKELVAAVNWEAFSSTLLVFELDSSSDEGEI